MDYQELFNIALGIISIIGGWTLRTIWDSMKELREQDLALSEKVSKIEILVAGEYVKREEFDKVVVRLFTKLDGIESVIRGK